MRFAGHSDGVTGAAISDDSRLAATLAYDSTARLWDMESGACLGVMPHGAAVNRAVFSVDGSLLLTASSDHLVLLWKIERSHKPHPVHVFKVRGLPTDGPPECATAAGSGEQRQ